MVLRKINSEGEDKGNHGFILEKASGLVWGIWYSKKNRR